MIRIVIGLFVFAVVLCGWIVIGPSSDGVADRVARTADGPATNAVSAPVTDTLALAVDDAVADVVSNAAANGDRLGAGVDVTRNQPAEVEPFQPALRQVTRIMEPASTIRMGDETLDQTTASILAGLGLETAAPQPPGADEMGQMTSSILSNIRAVTGDQPVPSAPSALSELVIGALRAGQTDQAINDLVNTAANAGAVSVPNVLVTADGRVDTSVLLASIVTQARVAAGQRAPVVPDVGGGGVEVRVVQTAADTEQFQFYTVGAGESLGGIAIKFYGDAAYFRRIFDANRTTLSSPDRIRAGQRLVIPRL